MSTFDTPYGLGGALIGGNDLPPMLPPVVKSPANPSDNNQVRAVVDMVNGTPATDQDGNIIFVACTMATLLINNEFPAESGYSVPANLGTTVMLAPDPLPSSPTAGVMYVNNPVLHEGGSWVTANRKTREIISLDTGISTSAPVDYSQLFQFIKHDGAFNPKGFQDPPPIGQPHAQKMPKIVQQTGPVIDSATVPAPDGIDGSVYDLLVTFVLDAKQADFGETGVEWGPDSIPIWFQGIKFYRRLTSHPDGGYIEVADMGFEADLTWEQAIEVGANNTYDIGIAFLDMSNGVSQIVWPAGSSDLIMPPLGGQNVGGLQNVNLLSDSQLSHPTSPWQRNSKGETMAGHMVYWGDFNSDFPNDNTCGYLKGSSPNGSNCFLVQNNNKDGVLRYSSSEFVEVANGFEYTASAYIDATQLQDNSHAPTIEIRDATGHTFRDDTPAHSLPLLVSVAQQSGNKGRVQVQWTCNSDSIQQVVFLMSANQADCNFMVMSEPQFEYGDTMTNYKPTTGLTQYGPPSQQGGSQPPKDVEVTLTQKSFRNYNDQHFTYGCDVNFTVAIDPDPSRWLDRVTLVYCTPGDYKPDEVSGYPVCGIVHPDQFPIGKNVPKAITSKIAGLPNGEQWDIYLVLYDGTGKARYKDGQGAWLIGTTTKQGKKSKQNDDPNLQASSISVGSYDNDGSTYGGTLTLNLSADIDPADWANGAKLFYVPSGSAFDPTNLTGYPACAHLPSTALVQGTPISIPFHGLACGKQFDLYLVLTDAQGYHHIVSNPAMTGGPTYGSGVYGTAVAGPSQKIATTTKNVISNGQVLGPIIAKAHLKGTTSTDYTTAIVDGVNNLIHGIMSTPLQAVVAGTVGGDGLYLNSGQINDRHINSVKLDTINDGVTYKRVAATEMTGNAVKQINDGTNIRTATQVSTVVAGVADPHGSYLALGCVYDAHIGGVVLDTIGDGTTYKRLKGVTSNLATWKSLLGDTSGDTTTSLVDAGNKRFLHTSMSTGVQTALDSSGNLLNISWPGIAYGSGGAMSGFATTGTSSAQALSLLAGQIVSFECQFKLASSGTQAVNFIIGNETNGYDVKWASGGAVTLGVWSSGTRSIIFTGTSVTQDTNVHSVKLTVAVGSPNKLEFSFDATNYPVQTNNALTLTSGTYPFTIADGYSGTMKVWQFEAHSAMPHRTAVHSDFQNTVNVGGGIDFSSGLHTNKVIDYIADTATRSAILTTETAGSVNSRTISRLNDGANIRTAAHVAGAIDTSSRIVGSIFDGVNTRTPGNITTALDGSGRIIGSLFDGVNTRTPGNVATALDASGRLIGNIYDGSNSRSPANITTALDGSGRIIGSIYNGTNTLSPTTLLGTVDTNGNILNNPFGSASGVVETSNGELTGFSTTGTSTHAVHPINQTGVVVNLSARLKLATAGSDEGIIFGGQSSGYALKWNGSTNSVDVGYYASGTFTVLANLGTLTQDTGWHAFQLSVTNTGSNAKVEASFDSLSAAPVTDIHVSLAGAKPGTVFTPSTGFVVDFDVEGALPLYSEMHSSVHTALDTTGRVIGNIYDSISGTALTPQNVTDVIGINISNNRGVVNVNPPGGAVGNLPLANHAVEVTDVIKTGGVFDASTAKSGTLLPYANHAAAVTNALDSSGNSKITPFGSSSGAVQAGSSGGITGIGSSGLVVQSVYPFSVGSLVVLSCNIQLGATGSAAGLYMNLPASNASVGIEWSSGGSVDTVYYNGTRNVIEHITTVAQDHVSLHSFCLVFYCTASGPTAAIVAGAFDGVLSPNGGLGLLESVLPLSGSFSPGIIAGGTSGIVQNLSIESVASPVLSRPGLSKILSNSADSNGSLLQHGVVYADQIAWSSGSPTGAVNLDSVPDGTTNGRVKISDLSSGHVVKTGSTGSFTIKGVGDTNTLSLDSEVADGTTYARLKAQNLNSGNLGTSFNSTALYEDTAGRIAGFASATQYLTNDAYPIVAAFPLTMSTWLQSGGSTANIFLMIGNQTNGIGIRWNTSGVVALAVFKAGTGTFTTIATVTRDTNLHWVSIKVTPGTTPGTTDAYSIFFDKNTLAGSTGTTAVTWGSTANCSVQLSNTASVLSQFRISSQQA